MKEIIKMKAHKCMAYTEWLSRLHIYRRIKFKYAKHVELDHVLCCYSFRLTFDIKYM